MAITATETAVENVELTDLAHGSSNEEAGPRETPPEEGPDERLSKLAYLRLISAGFSFFVAGTNDGSIGALIPYIIREYNVSTAIVSSV
jgi:hypothetical protein